MYSLHGFAPVWVRLPFHRLEMRWIPAYVQRRVQPVIAAVPLLPAGDTIAELTKRAAASGMAVTVLGELPPLPPMADRAAYRLVQEALTNAAKHAPGAPVTVRLGSEPTTAQAMVVVTNGAPSGRPRSSAASSGYGLIGLDERIRLAGGQLQAATLDSGFAVTGRLPLDARTAATPPDSQQRLAHARSKLRRSVLDAIWMPAAAAAALLAIMSAYDLYRP